MPVWEARLVMIDAQAPQSSLGVGKSPARGCRSLAIRPISGHNLQNTDCHQDNTQNQQGDGRADEKSCPNDDSAATGDKECERPPGYELSKQRQCLLLRPHTETAALPRGA